MQKLIIKMVLYISCIRYKNYLDNSFGNQIKHLQSTYIIKKIQEKMFRFKQIQWKGKYS